MEAADPRMFVAVVRIMFDFAVLYHVRTDPNWREGRLNFLALHLASRI